ncbi:MAG TPA: hypothetical protein VHO06_26660 [Polyangia bacterium]|nr:hypothetical protein [Polyangia bacterium]
MTETKDIVAANGTRMASEVNAATSALDVTKQQFPSATTAKLRNATRTAIVTAVRMTKTAKIVATIRDARALCVMTTIEMVAGRRAAACVRQSRVAGTLTTEC